MTLSGSRTLLGISSARDKVLDLKGSEDEVVGSIPFCDSFKVSLPLVLESLACFKNLKGNFYTRSGVPETVNSVPPRTTQ